MNHNFKIIFKMHTTSNPIHLHTHVCILIVYISSYKWKDKRHETNPKGFSFFIVFSGECIYYLYYTVYLQYAETGNPAHGSYTKLINIIWIGDALFGFNRT